MTELSPIGTMSGSKKIVYGSCGVLIPNTEAKIVDLKTGEALGPGMIGELCIRGPQVTLYSKPNMFFIVKNSSLNMFLLLKLLCK